MGPSRIPDVEQDPIHRGDLERFRVSFLSGAEGGENRGVAPLHEGASLQGRLAKLAGARPAPRSGGPPTQIDTNGVSGSIDPCPSSIASGGSPIGNTPVRPCARTRYGASRE